MSFAMKGNSGWLTLGMAHLELYQEITGEGSPYAQKDDYDYARDHSHDGEGGRQ